MEETWFNPVYPVSMANHAIEERLLNEYGFPDLMDNPMVPAYLGWWAEHREDYLSFRDYYASRLYIDGDSRIKRPTVEGEMLIRTEILTKANDIIAPKGDRGIDYGDPTEAYARIANVWTEVLNHEITAHQVALMMIGLKLIRATTARGDDTYVDLAGYAALAAEIKAKTDGIN